MRLDVDNYLKHIECNYKMTRLNKIDTYNFILITIIDGEFDW
jgi:hypothetical protein